MKFIDEVADREAVEQDIDRVIAVVAKVTLKMATSIGNLCADTALLWELYLAIMEACVPMNVASEGLQTLCGTPPSQENLLSRQAIFSIL